MPKTVTMAQARANLPQLVKTVSKGKRIVISRYNKPIAALVPVSAIEGPGPKVRRMGTGKGRVRIIDPHWADPMTDEEVDAMLEGRY